MFVTFGKRGGGRIVIAIKSIIAISDRTNGCEVTYFTGNETYTAMLGNEAGNALGLIEFELEQQQRREGAKR